jgi:hypothetical protein
MMAMNNESFDSPKDRALFEKIRDLCLSFPGTSERTSHGAPTFFIQDKKSFVQYHNNHHGDGKVGLWCASPSGIQMMHVESKPNIFYIPAYVGHLGWIGMRLDRDAEWKEISNVITDAYLTRAPKKLKDSLAR